MSQAHRELRIAVGGFHVECSTFSNHRTTISDLTLRRGDELLAQYAFTAGANAITGIDWVPIVHARTIPGGPVTPDAFDTIATELLERLRAAATVDGLLLDLHGAMAVPGHMDIEAELVARIRTVIGPSVLIAVPMDLHGNVSATLAGHVNIVTAHRMAPHEDEWLTRRRAAEILVRCLRSGVRPLRAWVQVPVLLPGEKTSTRVEPAASLYARVAELAATDGVLDAALFVGYPWADEPRCRAAVVVTGTDRDAITSAATEIANRYFAARDEFGFVGPVGTLTECLDEALVTTERPYFISDTGDNPTAGGSGDSCFAAAVLIADTRFGDAGGSAIIASIFDPEAIARLSGKALGDHVEVAAGGWLDARPARPVRLVGVLTSRVADPIGGIIAVVTVGGVHVILTEKRKPYHHVADLTGLGLEPSKVDAVVIKIGYLEPDLHAAAGMWRMALTPGAVDQRLDNLVYRRLIRPISPLEGFDVFTPEPAVFGG